MYPFINHNQNDVISKMFWKNLHTLFYTLLGDCKWNPVEYKELKNHLVEISEKQADNKIKEIEGDEYDLVDGYVLCDFSGEV